MLIAPADSVHPMLVLIVVHFVGCTLVAAILLDRGLAHCLLHDPRGVWRLIVPATGNDNGID